MAKERSNSPKTARAEKRTGKRQVARRSPATGTKIHVITDGTGGLPRHILTAILSQFPNLKSAPHYHIICDTTDHVDRELRKIRSPSIVLHALTNPQVKQHLVQAVKRKKDVSQYDLTGGLVNFLAQQTGETPLNEFHAVHTRDESYYDRIDAWEFTMQHDDSRRLESIDEADIVLVGLSRVSKTPTAAYLGWLGYRVANVSYAPETGLPKELKKCRGKVVALTMQPKRLAEIRSRRLKINRFADAVARDRTKEFRYAGVRDTIREVMDAETTFKRMRYPMIDTTDATVEDTAARVIQLLEEMDTNKSD
jgi:regulator of PEP synthase PpsR (kinase-PPPase family)